MQPLSISLGPSIRDLTEAVSDFARTPYQSCESVLARFVYHLDEEPIAGFLQAVLPAGKFSNWHAKTNASTSSLVGSATLDWPAPRAERVALQVSLCRELVAKDLGFLDFVHEHFDAGRSVQAHIQKFADLLLVPLVRDITRLTELRPVPPVLFEAMGTLPTSGDSVLDDILREARMKFKDPAPQARMEATQKLWDAWERLKSLDDAQDKRLSTKALLDRCAAGGAFRQLLESEARELTKVGNDFQIRHFETNREPFASPEHVDYLFHRLFALIHLLLFARRSDV